MHGEINEALAFEGAGRNSYRDISLFRTISERRAPFELKEALKVSVSKTTVSSSGLCLILKYATATSFFPERRDSSRLHFEPLPAEPCFPPGELFSESQAGTEETRESIPRRREELLIEFVFP
jgi:hypothetical protein